MPKTETIIHGKRIYLKPFRTSDIHSDYLNWLNDPVVNEFSRRRHIKTTRADAEQFLNGLAANEEILGIYDKENDIHIGNIQYGPIDEASAVAEIRIMVGNRNYWGKGIATEAIYILSKYLFDELNMHRLEANTCNPAFVRCMEKLGWVREGKLREKIKLEKGRADFIWFGLLQSEFKESPKFEQ